MFSEREQRVSRRVLGKRAFLLSASFITQVSCEQIKFPFLAENAPFNETAQQEEQKAHSVELVTAEQKSLGEKLVSWALPEGTRMPDISKGFDEAGGVFLANSLKQYIPTALFPVTFSYMPYKQGEAPAQLNIIPKYSQDTSKKIIAEAPGAKPFEIPFISSVIAKIEIVETLRGMAAELVVAAKEASQIVDYIDYCKAFQELLEIRGAKFRVENPGKEPVSGELVALTIAQGQISVALSRKESPWFIEFVSNGSFIRIGGIGYANWYVNYPEEVGMVPPELHAMGQSAAGFLQHEGLIRQEGRKFIWSAGEAPKVGSKDFVVLFNRFLTGPAS